MKPVFYNRSDAGVKLAEMLERHQGSGALVLAIPSGGVPVAAEIARALALPLDVASVSKVLFPWTTESGYGAVAFDGSVWIDNTAVDHWGLTREQVEGGIAEARAKVEQRVVRLRGARPFAELAGRTVLLVDDGIAAGSTMCTAIATLRRQAAGRIIVAVPTAHDRSHTAIAALADEIYCANLRCGPRFAVADAYETWRDRDEDEVAAMLGR